MTTPLTPDLHLGIKPTTPNYTPSIAKINSLIRNTVLLQMVENNAKSRPNPYNMGNMGSMAIFEFIFWCGNIIFYCEKWL